LPVSRDQKEFEDNRTVTVLHPDGTETTVTDALDGEDVVPGFKIDVRELLEDL